MSTSSCPPPAPIPSQPSATANLVDVEGDVEWVDRSPTGLDPAISEAWAQFAAHYPDIAAELFDNDTELTTCIGPRDSGPV